MPAKIVFYEGEQYYVVGEVVKADTKNDGKEELSLMFALNKVECSERLGISRVIWIYAQNVVFIRSDVDFAGSDWYEGILRGFNE